MVIVGTGTNIALPSNLDFFFLPCNFQASKRDFERNADGDNVAFLERKDLQFRAILYKVKALRPGPTVRLSCSTFRVSSRI